MKKNQGLTRNLILGLFVILGTLLLVIALYQIGLRQNYWGNTFRLRAQFKTVNGLTEGNAVRFTGIDIGSVEKVEITSDTTVEVTMLIQKKIRPFIRINSKAVVGTDGLMGNRLINITPGSEPNREVKDMDMLLTNQPFDTEAMLQTFAVTNLNAAQISIELKEMAQKLNRPNSVWQILSDTGLSKNLADAIIRVKQTGNQIYEVAEKLNLLSDKIKNGEGLLGELISDTANAEKINGIIKDLKTSSERIKNTSEQINRLTGEISQGKGTAGLLLVDTLLSEQVKQTLKNIHNSSTELDAILSTINQHPILNRMKKRIARREK